MHRARNTYNKRACLWLLGSGQEFIVFDTETTGKKSESDYIVELAAQKYRASNGRVELISEIDIYIKPPFKMEQAVIDIHGITNEFLERKLPETMLFNEIRSFFGNNPIVVGYNIDFDVAMTKSLYRRNSEEFKPMIAIDVLEMVRDIIYGKDNENYKLGYITESLGLDTGLTFHQAIDDVKATTRILSYCYKEYISHPTVQGQKLYVNRVYYWKGYNKKQSGVYVETNMGRIYFSTFLKAWQSSQVELEKMDIDALERDVIGRLCISGIKELGRMTEKKFGLIKDEQKKRGVYL